MERATLNRRAAALLIDWAASTAVAVALTGNIWDPRTNQWNLLIFLAEVLLFTILLGGSFGQLFVGIRIETIDGGRPNPLAVVVRTLLLVLVIPAVLVGADGRGLHDRTAGTQVCRFR
jgi:uncharacterized RDD family membrane protein YckC